MRIVLPAAWLFACFCLLAGSAQAAAPYPAPENLNIRIVGTANFQGKYTALIEDANTHVDSFYRVGDPIYGHKICEITRDGMTLEKAGQKYYVPMEQTALAAGVPHDGTKAVVANTYLPESKKPAVAANFYTDGGKSTPWDAWNATLVKPLWGGGRSDNDGPEPGAPEKHKRKRRAAKP